METPPLHEALRAAMDSRAQQIRTAMPARVIAYSRTRQTADLRPEVWPGGQEAPIVPRVPVMWPRGGSGYLLFPLEEKTKWVPGDTGLLVCCESDLAEWRRTGEAGRPADEATHHLQNAVFIPGLVPDGNELDAPAGATVLDGAGDLRLGAASATHPLLFGDDFATDLNTFLTALNVWFAAVAAAVPALAGPSGTIIAAANALNGAMPGNQSTQVKTK